MRRLTFLLLTMALTGCGGQTLPRPAAGYDAITTKQRLVFDSLFNRYVITAGTTLVGDREFNGRQLYCALGTINGGAFEVCVFPDGQDLVIAPGTLKEIRITPPPGTLEKSKV